MNILTTDKTGLVIVGASGMVGGYALRYALDDPGVGSVTSIGRRKLGISHPKLKEVLHQDFADCSALAEALSGQDAAVFCLGAYTGAVSLARAMVTVTVLRTGARSDMIFENSDIRAMAASLRTPQDDSANGSI
jgi:putative NADH-flavin reductase